jgi:hypothetical protein
MGHGSMRAALIYQHATSEPDREIAAALDLRIGRATGEKWPGSGPTVGIEQPATSDLENETLKNQGSRSGAGDENRTRMTSLEVRRIHVGVASRSGAVYLRPTLLDPD